MRLSNHGYAAIAFLFILNIPAALADSDQPAQPVDSVNPFLGTGDHGHTYPGASAPFGMVQLSPDTNTEGWDHCSGYHYDDPMIQGFTHTHLTGTGCGDLGDILLMPTVGGTQLQAGPPGSGYFSRFSHKNESASPGYYRVFLESPRVTAELTATTRVGFHKYTFPATDHAHIVLDLVHGIGNTVREAGLTVESPDTVSGYRKMRGWASDRTVYFVMQFSRPFDSSEIEQDGHPVTGTQTAKGNRLKAVFNYQTKEDESILIKVGLSATGIEGARKNLNAEVPGWDFKAVCKQTADKWNEVLGSIEVETPDAKTRRTFYSNLYLACLAPTLYNDADGSYEGMDHKAHPNSGFQDYTELSLWDIFRTEAPLLTIIQPSRVDDIVGTMMAEYNELGQHALPVWPLWNNETWCMIGYHSIPIITDAYFKGFRRNDPETCYQAMRDTAMQDRSGLADYRKLGYVPSRPGAGATSWTLEYAYDDACIAHMAEALGHKEDAQLFYKRAANYRNVFDSTTGFFRGRKADGSWRTPFAPYKLVNDEYTEADAWQYAFCVQHDIPGLIQLLGGDEKFLEKFDALLAADSHFEPFLPDITGMVGQYSQGDEQCHHVAYVPNFAGAPWKTQKLVRKVMTTFYDDSEKGECGNDDCGQMSAWYIMSAMGFFPVDPASGNYVIGSPIVDKAVIHLDPNYYKGAAGNTFTVIAENNSPQNIYIQSAALNGKPLTHSWFTHADLAAGGELHLVMGPNPNLEWGSAAADRPPSAMPPNMTLDPLPDGFVEIPPKPLTLPIRLSVVPADGFVLDADYADGSINQSSSTRIDAGAPNAAPEAVYQGERYGDPLTYTIPVPKGRYTVRLHFAEIFDGDPGARIENISINGDEVLKNFEISAAAGGLNKAVVRDFPGIKPTADGHIVIKIAPAPGSPDRNAKISGVEILE
jgi:predicted alpha-1,2-mannosidase